MSKITGYSWLKNFNLKILITTIKPLRGIHAKFNLESH